MRRPGVGVGALLAVLALAATLVVGSVWIFRLTRDDASDHFRQTVYDAYYQDLNVVSSALAGAKAGTELDRTRAALAERNRYSEFALVDLRTPTVIRKCFVDQPTCVAATLPKVMSEIGLTHYFGFDWLDTNGGHSVLVGASPMPDEHPRFALVEWFTDPGPGRDPLAALPRRLTYLVSAALGLSLAAILATAGYLAWRVRRMRKGAERFGRGDLDARLPERGGGGLARLAGSVNGMAVRMTDTVRDLHESQTLQQRFVADVSHELRTPLAATLAAAEGLDSDDAQTRDRSVALVRAQTRRLVKLVGDLLEMSRFDAGQAAVETESIDLTEIVHDVVRTVAPEADVRVTTLGDTTAEIDVRRIHAILRNLVANALQHGEPPVDIVIDGQRNEELSITVADDGPGVPSFLVPVIFERFARADAARGSEGAHSGLGLAIATENARLHGATITLAASGRTAFTLRLPRRVG